MAFQGDRRCEGLVLMVDSGCRMSDVGCRMSDIGSLVFMYERIGVDRCDDDQCFA